MEKRNLEMFGCALDLSKAYDRVSQYKLFSKLLDAECPAYMVKFLQVWYDGRAYRSNGMIDYPVPLECGMA